MKYQFTYKPNYKGTLTLKELRWNKIKGHVNKAKGKFNSNWMIVFPSTEQDYFHLLELPFVKDKGYYESYDHTDVVYNLIKDDDCLDQQLFKVLGYILNIQTKDIEYNKLSDMLWFVIHYFNNRGDNVEVYEDDRVTFVDFNLQQTTVH